MKILAITHEGRGGGAIAYFKNLYQWIDADQLFLPNPYKYQPILNYKFIKKVLSNELKNNNYDLIHNNWVRHLPKIKKDTKVVTTVHHLIFKREVNKRSLLTDTLYFFIEGSTIKKSDYLITDCKMMKDKILRYYSFPKDKIFVIPLAVDNSVYYPQNLPEENFILFPNALREPKRKGFYFILPILKKLLEKYNLKCIITGKISEEGKKLYAKLTPNFEYLGYIDNRNLAKLYNQAIFVVFPSLHEGYGLVPLEVIASGGIIISSDAGAVKEYLKDGKNGYVIPLIREKWMKVLVELIEDPTLREDIRKNNQKEKIRSWKDCAKDHLKIFKKIVEN